MAVHFIGFDPLKDPDSFHRAVKVFGYPDFIHKVWDYRAKCGGEFDSTVHENGQPEDVRVFKKGTENDPPNPYTYDDSNDGR